MVLSNVDIAEALKEKRFIIDPLPGPQDFATSSVDLHLSDEFLAWDQNEAKKTAGAMGYSEYSIDVSAFDFRGLASKFLTIVPHCHDGSIILNPHDFLLSTTMETVGNSMILPRFCGHLGKRVNFAGEVIHEQTEERAVGATSAALGRVQG
ncbi:MAG: dCTP deaminase domain-containing protein [Thermodesulfobacteriota bacterium]